MGNKQGHAGNVRQEATGKGSGSRRRDAAAQRILGGIVAGAMLATAACAGPTLPSFQGVGQPSATLSDPLHAASWSAPATRGPWQPPSVSGQPFPRRVERWRPLVRQLLAEAWDEGRLDGHASKLDDDVVLALIQQESAGDPDAESWAGALGLMQVMPFTFADMMHGDKRLTNKIPAEAFFDPASNGRAGIRYLAKAMQEHEGNLYWALASYNAGIEAVYDWRAVGLYAVPPVGGYVETANYTQIVLRNYLVRRPEVHIHVPDPMPREHVPGAVQLLKEAGRW